MTGSGGPAQILVVARSGARYLAVAPERVGEYPNGTSGGPDVFHFSAGNPVVNRAAADTNHITCARD